MRLIFLPIIEHSHHSSAWGLEGSGWSKRSLKKELVYNWPLLVSTVALADQMLVAVFGNRKGKFYNSP